MKTKTITYLNNNFRFVYSPNFYSLPFLFGEMRNIRFLIGAGQIGKYITEKNAKKVILATEKMKTDKKIIKFRKYGKIEIYVK